MKEYDAIYYLYADGADAGGPLVGVNIGGYQESYAASDLPTNTWSHVAGTWDGSTLRVYVNGTPVASRAVNGTLTNTTYPLRIGGNSLWGEYLAGRIDEVRVYNRALSQFEIQSDMNTPIGSTLPTPTPGTAFWDDLDPVRETWTSSAAQGTDDWGLSTDYSHSPTHAAFCSEPETVKDDYALTRSILVPTGGQLSFWHTYQLEAGYDGAVIEISTDGGATFTDLESHIATGGYTGQIATDWGSPIAGRSAWTGGSLGPMSEVVVDLSSYAGQSVILRFRLATDTGTGGGGWYIDDVLVSDFTPTPTPTPISTSGDDFNRADSTNLGPLWTERAGDWHISSQTLSNADAGELTLASFNGGSYSNVAVSVQMQITGGNGTAGIGVRGYSEGQSDTGYAAELDSGQVTLWRVDNWAELGACQIAGYQVGQWVTMTLRAQGSTLTVQVNNAPCIIASDNAFTSGEVELWSYQPTNADQHRFDNFVVQALGSSALTGKSGLAAPVRVSGPRDTLRAPALDTPPTGQTWRTYYYAGSTRVAMRVQQAGVPDVVYYLQADHLGSASLTIDANGAEIPNSRTGYYPYGVTRYGGTGLPTDRRFTGQREEASLGSLYDYGARAYSPILGRFLSADTLVPSPGNPQALNRYAYAQNNPLKYTDPSGHFIAPIIGVALIAAGVIAGAIEARQVSNYAQEHNMGFWEVFASKDLTLDQQEMVRGAADTFATVVTLGMAAAMGGGQSIEQLGMALNNPQIFGAGMQVENTTAAMMGAAPTLSTRHYGTDYPEGKPEWSYMGKTPIGGGQVYGSDRPIAKADAQDISLRLYGGTSQKTPLHILSGVHGTTMGDLVRAPEFYLEDVEWAQQLIPGAQVHDVWEMRDAQIKALSGNVVCAWCFSDRSTRIQSILLGK
jgi:RHS repeat-associated protein